MAAGKFYALMAGIIWGFTPIFAKLALGGASSRLVMVFGTLSGAGLIVVIGLAQGTSGWFGLPLPTLLVYMATGVTGSFFGHMFYIKGIDKIGGARATSIVNASPLLTTFFATLLLGERFTAVIGAGIVLIVGGIYLISAQRADQGPQRYRRLDLLWPLLSAFCYSFNPVLKRLGMTMTPAPILGIFYSHGTSSVLFLISFLIRQGWREARSVAPRYLLFTVLAGFATSLGGYMTYLAVQDQPALIVSSIWRITPLVSLFLSYLMLRGAEEVTLKDLLGTVTIVAGVVILLRLAR
ncbi:MAG: DMT family transporter [Candidatus Tectomicrobia bacterium]|nr:DMT family transporter [Candidatus Tectomicrobia bacterium]